MYELQVDAFMQATALGGKGNLIVEVRAAAALQPATGSRSQW